MDFWKRRSGTIDAPIARKEDSIIQRCISENGDRAITHYEIIEENKKQNYSIVRCLLETGRTHQIRVHMAHIGHSILGDTLYGSASPFISRQALHSYITSFIHPITKEKVEYLAPIPEDMNL